MTKAALYHFVESKAALLAAAIDDEFDRLERCVIRPALQIADPQARLIALTRGLMVHVSAIEGRGGAVAVFFNNVGGLVPATRCAVEIRFAQFHGLLVSALAELRAEGRLSDSIHLDSAATAITGFALGATSASSFASGEKADEAVETVVDMTLRGILA